MRKIALIISSVAIMGITACRGTKDEKPANNEKSEAITITGTTWQLQSLNGDSDLSSFTNGKPEITFTADNTVNGNGGCNTYSGSYKLDDTGNISISRIMSTKMYCNGVPESEYYKVLESADTINIGEELVIKSNGNITATFKAKE